MTSTQASAPPDRKHLDVEGLLRYAAAVLTAGAGFIHLDASGDHPAHTHITVFFVVLGIAQIAWAAGVAWSPERTRLLRAGLIGTAGVLAIWVVSRTTGIPFVDGAGETEAVALKDALASFLEVLTLGAGGLLLALPEQARRAALPSAERVSAALLASALALTVPGVLAGHGHGDGHGAHGDGAHVAGAHTERDDAHGHRGEGEQAAGHLHGDGVRTASGHMEHQHTEHVALPDAGHAGHAAGTPVGAAHAHGDGADAGHDGHVDGGHTGHFGHSGGSGGSGPAIVTAAQQRKAFRAAPGEVVSVRWGPIVVPGASTNEARHSQIVLSNTVLTQLPPPCRDCYLTALAPQLVNADGSQANFDSGAWLHHNVTFSSDEDDPTCNRQSAIGFLGKRIFAAGNERTVASFPRGFGYFVGDGAWWSAVFEIMNTKEEPQAVFFEFKAKYLPGDADVKPVEPVWLDFDNCSDSELDLSAGRTKTSWEWKSNMTGRILAAAGHVHNGGVYTELTNASTGEHVCKSVAGYGTRPGYQGNIDTMSVCAWDRIGRVREGQTLRLDTVYDSATPVPGAMGIMVIFIHETEKLNGGTRAPRSMTDPPDGGTPPADAGHDH